MRMPQLAKFNYGVKNENSPFFEQQIINKLGLLPIPYPWDDATASLAQPAPCILKESGAQTVDRRL